MQARPPAPRNSPPASSTPLSDYLRREHPGVTEGYVVLPRALVEGMPLPWQQQMVNLLAQFHDGHARLDWPAYRVVPSRPERLVDLDEEQLAEAGYLVEIDSEGEMVYRERSGRKVDDPDSVTVLVSCLDPVVERSRPQADRSVPDQGRAAPMNIGPQPVWETPPSGFIAQAPQPPQSPPPQSPQPSTAQAAQTGQAAQAGQVAQTGWASQSEWAPQAAGPATASGSFPAVAPSTTPPPSNTPPSDAAQRDWFDEMPADSTSDSDDSAAGATGGDDEGAVFGPTGAEPTQIPYRFRR
nr:hypothetical protein [Prauserella isguenensis]